MDGTTQYWNTASEKLYGYSEKEALGKSLLELIIPPEMRSDVWQAIQQMAKTGQPIPAAELSLMRKDGSRVTVYSSHAVVYIPGLAPELFCLDVDLTERKRTASLLNARVRISAYADTHNLDDLLQKTLDEAEVLTGSQIGFAHFLQEDQMTLHLQMWSTNTLAHMCTAEGKGNHYPVEEAGVWAECVSTRVPVIHNDYANLSSSRRKGLPEGHAPIVRELVVPILRNDLIVMIMGVGNKPFDYDDNDVEVINQLADSVWDIVQRKQAEEALQTSELFIKSVLNSITAHIAVLNEQGKIVAVNEAWKQYARENGSLNPESYIGTNYFSACEAAIQQGDKIAIQVDRAIHAVMNGLQDEFSIEYPCHSPSQKRWFTVTVVPQQKPHQGVIVIHQDITERKQAEQMLEEVNIVLQDTLVREQELARTDPLLGINNRRHLFEMAEHEFEVAMRYQQPLSVMMYDLDHFKKVNDTFDHSVGDLILQHVTQIVRDELRSADVIGRYGGEEFIVILPMTSAQQAFPLAERIRMNVEKINISTPKGNAGVTLSIGIVELTHTHPVESVEDVFRRADEAMYAAKQAGRNRTEIR